MSFASLGRSLLRSARSRFPRVASSNGNNGARPVLSGEALLHKPCIGYENVAGTRGYLISLGANKAVGVGNRLLDWRFLLTNPNFRRFFSSGNPNKKSDSSTEDHGNFQENFIKQRQSLITPLIFIGLLFSSFSGGSFDQKEISFQEFKNKLLEAGLVDHIVVSNKSVAKVYVRNSPQINNQTQDNEIHGPTNDVSSRYAPSRYKYYFNIGSVESFEEKLEEAQEALGMDPHDYIPVTYVSEVIWYQELLKFAPTAFLLGFIYFMGKRLQGGLSVGGGTGKGNRGIFNIGKAHVTKMDKNSKNKVFFKDVAGCDEAKQAIMEFVHFLKNPESMRNWELRFLKEPFL